MAAFERWISADVAPKSYAAEDLLFEAWESYLKTIGPSVARAYREGKLQEFPHDHLFERVKGRMQQMAREMLIAEELAQDDAEKQQTSKK